jgi:hypothetical protein
MNLTLHLPLGTFFPTLFYSHSGLNKMPSFNNFMMFFLRRGGQFCRNVKNKYEKKNIQITHFFGERKVIRFEKKFENHVATFSYWFSFGKLPCLNFLNF